MSALCDTDDQQQDTHVQTSQDQQQHQFEEGDPVEFEGRQFFFLDLKRNLQSQRTTQQQVKQQQQEQQQQHFTVKEEIQDFGAYALVDLLF